MEHTNLTAQSIFESVTEYHVLTSEFLSENFLHTNYLITSNTAEQFVVRLPNYLYANEKDFRDEFMITRQTQKHQYDIPCIYFDLKQGIKITKYIATTAALSVLSSDQLLSNIASELFQFHHLNYDLNIEYNPLNKLTEMLSSLNLTLEDNERAIVEQAKLIFACEPLVYCHNYLQPINILIRDESIYFINYMYFGKNIAIYDIAGLLHQSKIKNERSIKLFLSSYYKEKYNKKHYEDCLVMIKFNSIMWKYYELIRANHEF